MMQHQPFLLLLALKLYRLGSPAKLIESRSKLYKQLSELQNLKSMGVLTDTEYIEEKETIMGLLGKLGRGNNSK